MIYVGVWPDGSVAFARPNKLHLAVFYEGATLYRSEGGKVERCVVPHHPWIWCEPPPEVAAKFAEVFR